MPDLKPLLGPGLWLGQLATEKPHRSNAFVMRLRCCLCDLENLPALQIVSDRSGGVRTLAILLVVLLTPALQFVSDRIGGDRISRRFCLDLCRYFVILRLFLELVFGSSLVTQVGFSFVARRNEPRKPAVAPQNCGQERVLRTPPFGPIDNGRRGCLVSCRNVRIPFTPDLYLFPDHM